MGRSMTQSSDLAVRLATPADIPAIAALQQRAIAQLQGAYLTPAQVEASRAGMGLDTTLIGDGTYFCVKTAEGQLAGCGGWSRRATLYGGDHSAGRDARPSTRTQSPHGSAPCTPTPVLHAGVWVALCWWRPSVLPAARGFPP